MLTGHRDWKKLTFYYFADSYINFNSLVTDLFKIYKTRIWMSAINPASFASPTLGLQAPSGIGPGAVGVGRGAGNAERRENRQAQEQQPPAAAYPGNGQAGGRGFQGSFNQAFPPDRPVVPASAYPQQSYPYSQYPTFGGASRPANVPYVPGMMPNIESYQAGFQQGGEYPAVRSRFPNPQAGGAPHEQGMSPMTPQGDWVGAFQGLSLNTR
jgi:PSP1 C-terminal conserved region